MQTSVRVSFLDFPFATGGLGVRNVVASVRNPVVSNTGPKVFPFTDCAHRSNTVAAIKLGVEGGVGFLCSGSFESLAR